MFRNVIKYDISELIVRTLGLSEHTAKNIFYIGKQSRNPFIQSKVWVISLQYKHTNSIHNFKKKERNISKKYLSHTLLCVKYNDFMKSVKSVHLFR